MNRFAEKSVYYRTVGEIIDYLEEQFDRLDDEINTCDETWRKEISQLQRKAYVDVWDYVHDFKGDV